MKIDQGILKNAKSILRAIDHQERQTLLKLIEEKGQSDVTSLYKELGLEQAACSQHLAKLRKAGVVETRRDGKMIFYSVRTEKINHINQVLSQL